MPSGSASDGTPDTDPDTVARHIAAEFLRAVPEAPDQTDGGASVTHTSQDHLSSSAQRYRQPPPSFSAHSPYIKSVPPSTSQQQMGHSYLRRTDIYSERRPLTPEQLNLFRTVVEDRFLVPFLEKRARTPAA
jgi:hypothetical protein